MFPKSINTLHCFLEGSYSIRICPHFIVENLGAIYANAYNDCVFFKKTSNVIRNHGPICLNGKFHAVTERLDILHNLTNNREIEEGFATMETVIEFYRIIGMHFHVFIGNPKCCFFFDCFLFITTGFNKTIGTIQITPFSHFNNG